MRRPLKTSCCEPNPVVLPAIGDRQCARDRVAVLEFGDRVVVDQRTPGGRATPSTRRR